MPEEDDSQYQLQKKSKWEVWVPAIHEVIRIPWFTPREGTERRRLEKIMLYRKIQNSPAPTWVKKLQRWAKITDDIQDFLVTTEVCGKIAIRAIKRWAPKLAAKVIGRAIPGLGWILLASDVLNLATAALSAPTGPTGLKRVVEAFIHGLPKKGKVLRRAAKKLETLRTTWREWVQVAQCTEELTGVGLRVGAIMGFMTDAFFGFFKGATWRYPWERPDTLEYMAYRALKSAREAAPHVHHLGPEWTARVAVVHDAAAEVLAHQAQVNPWPETALDNEHLKIPTIDEIDPFKVRWPIEDIRKMEPKQVLDPTSREILEVDFGLDPDEEVGYLGYPEGDAPTLGEIIDAPLGQEGNDLLNALQQHKDNVHARYGHDAIIDNSTFWNMICSCSDDETEEYYEEQWSAMLRMFLYRLYPPAGTPIEVMEAAYQELAEYIRVHGHFPPWEEALEICERIWGGVCRRAPCV